MTGGFLQQRKRTYTSRSYTSNRISSLPDEVIHKILSLLPIREAIATSTLSKSWRYKWNTMPELRFAEDSAIQGETFEHRIKLIDKVLLFHIGEITKFEIIKFLHSASPDLGSCLFFLSRHELSHLELRFKYPSSSMLPSNLFNCQNLKTLILDSCALAIPPRTIFNGLNNLTTLWLLNVTTSSETIGDLVKYNPHLENLVVSIHQSSLMSQLSISALNLKMFEIHGNCEGIAYDRTPELRQTKIRIMLRGEVARSKLDRVLKGLVKIRKANIFCPFIERLSIENFWLRWEFTYNHLKYLYLDINFEDPKQILASFWLFRCSPALKRIEIKVGRNNKGIHTENLCVDEIYRILANKETILPSLEMIGIRSFGGSESELRFIQFVLLSARVLQMMKIKWTKNDPGVRTREAATLRKLLEFKRTSSGMTMALDSVCSTVT